MKIRVGLRNLYQTMFSNAFMQNFADKMSNEIGYKVTDLQVERVVFDTMREQIRAHEEEIFDLELEDYVSSKTLDERIDGPLSLEYEGLPEMADLESDLEILVYVTNPHPPLFPEEWTEEKRHTYLDEEIEHYYMHWFDDRDIDTNGDLLATRCDFFRKDGVNRHLHGYASDFHKGGKFYAAGK